MRLPLEKPNRMNPPNDAHKTYPRMQQGVTNDLEEELVDLIEKLTNALYELEESGKDTSIKNVDYERKRAKVLVGIGGKNKEEREALAYTDEVSEADLAAQLAKHNNVLCLKRVDVLKQQLSALQTRFAARKAEASSIRFGQM